jgi:nucleoside-diphosphate-sugar epimerase
MTVLLTGASGFVGKAVLKTAHQRGLNIRPVFRSLDSAKGHPEAVLVSGLDGAADWSQALQGVDVVIHVAARAHIMREEALDPLDEYRRVNVQGTLNLARQAAAAGVGRFVFIVPSRSTARQQRQASLTADDAPAPEMLRLSKAEAEAQLKLLAQETGMR